MEFGAVVVWCSCPACIHQYLAAFVKFETLKVIKISFVTRHF